MRQNYKYTDKLSSTASSFDRTHASITGNTSAIHPTAFNFFPRTLRLPYAYERADRDGSAAVHGHKRQRVRTMSSPSRPFERRPPPPSSSWRIAFRSGLRTLHIATGPGALAHTRAPLSVFFHPRNAIKKKWNSNRIRTEGRRKPSPGRAFPGVRYCSDAYCCARIQLFAGAIKPDDLRVRRRRQSSWFASGASFPPIVSADPAAVVELTSPYSVVRFRHRTARCFFFRPPLALSLLLPLSSSLSARSYAPILRRGPRGNARSRTKSFRDAMRRSEKNTDRYAVRVCVLRSASFGSRLTRRIHPLVGVVVRQTLTPENAYASMRYRFAHGRNAQHGRGSKGAERGTPSQIPRKCLKRLEYFYNIWFFYVIC